MKVADGSSIPYIKNLDGLRALAIMLVLFNHWAPWSAVPNILEFGRSGLLLFFMLSGYLITTVLIVLRDKIENHELNISKAFQIFYMRRVLRIFPIYFIAIVIAALLFKSVSRDFIYHLFFIQNFSALWAPEIPAYEYAYHLWSLAVEEQFYLVWAPVILLLVGPNKMVKICLTAILISLVFKLYCALDHSHDATDRFPRWTILWVHRLNTLGNIDTLAIGCLVALDARYRLVDWVHGVGNRFFKVMQLLVIPIFIIIIAYTEMLGNAQARASGIYIVLHDSMMQIPLWLLLHNVVHGGGGKILGNPFVVWIGKKSYGIYVWHEFVNYAVTTLSINVFNYKLETSLFRFLVLVLTTFLIATISWKFIEEPFLKFKNKWSDTNDNNYKIIYNTKKEIINQILRRIGSFISIPIILSVLGFLAFGFGTRGFAVLFFLLGAFTLYIYFIIKQEINKGYFNLKAMPIFLRRLFELKKSYHVQQEK
jgi:peptidoglycan/LPS O-acetylase OafA/YrhL